MALNVNKALNRVGFTFIAARELRRWWPSLTLKEAYEYMQDYIEIPVGTAGYDWTAKGAAQLAKAYVQECD